MFCIHKSQIFQGIDMGSLNGMRTLMAAVVAMFALGGAPLQSAEKSMSLTQAIQRLLESGPGVQIDNESVRQSAGLFERTAGQFDWMLTNGVSMERRHIPVSGRLRNFERDENFALGLGRQLRNGVSFSVTATSFDLTDNLTNVEPLNGADVSALVIVPLLRGLGRNNTGAGELAAKSALDATGLLTGYSISGHIYDLTSAYWDYLAAVGYLEIQKKVQENELKMLDIVDKLVSTGELAFVFLEQTKGNLNTTRRGISDAEYNLYASRQDIAVRLGYAPQDLDQLPLPSEDFPELVDPDSLPESAQARLFEESLKNRGDYLATLKNIDTERIYLHQAENNRKPSLDLNLKLGYAGLQEDGGRGRFLKSYSNNVAGVNSYLGLQLEFPIVNHDARGQVGYRESLLRESEIRKENLANGIASEINVTLESMRRAVLEYRLAEQSGSYFLNVVDFEVEKAKNGSPDLTSLYIGLDRYRGAMIARIDAQRKYAVSLARLRLATGTVLAVRGDGWAYISGAMVQLPPIQ
jgi:outer membrane protein TolC